LCESFIEQNLEKNKNHEDKANQMIEQIWIENSMKIQEYETQLRQLLKYFGQIASDVEIDPIAEESEAV
jgi:hypothetical protein